VSTSYTLRCEDCVEEANVEVWGGSGKDDLREVFASRELIRPLMVARWTVSLSGGESYGDLGDAPAFVVKHRDHKVVIRDEYGKDHPL
jgi:hypothetical protein